MSVKGASCFSIVLSTSVYHAHACVGGYRGVPPEGHPNVQGAPDIVGNVEGSETLWPCAGTSVCRKALRDYGGIFSPRGPWVPGQNVSMRFLESVANLSATLNEDLCYWSQQTLPAPPDDAGRHHIDEYDAPRVINIYGELATSRLQQKMSSVDAINFVGCAYGSELRQAQCMYGQNKSVSCSRAVSQQKIKWPVSSVMLKINPGTIQEIADLIYTWRTTESGHWPNMHAGFNRTSGAFAWGYKGSLFAKIVKCKDIPAGIIKQSYACDEINPKSSRIYADDWWEVWENLCNIYEDPLIPSTLETCRDESAGDVVV